MSIKGLSERRRLPRLGKIRLGVMVQEPGKKPYPRATDFFVCPPEVEAVYGPHPTELPIMFPLDNPDLLFPQVYKMYRSAGLFCSGDGVTAKRWNDSGNLVERECPCPFLEQGDCSPVATLNFLLPDVEGIGVFQLSTSNKNSIVGINSALELYQASFGGLAGIPFLLKLEPAEVQRFDEKRNQMVKTKLHVLWLAAPEKVTWRQLLELRGQGTPTLALLPPPSGDEPEDMLPAGQPENGPLAPAGASPTQGSNAAPAVGTRPVASPLSPAESSESGAPVSPGGRASATPAGGRDDLSAFPEWTIETCFQAVKALGVAREDYEGYLLGVYSVEAGSLSADNLAEQIGLLRQASASPASGITLGQAIRTVAGKIRKRKGPR